MAEYFLDTAYAIALSVRKDSHHHQALALADTLQSAGNRLVTTRAVLIEIGDGITSLAHRAGALALLNSLDDNPEVDVVELTRIIYDRAVALFRQRPDKEWGLTDCISFVVMEERGLTDALTADRHFQQAGFRALLLEP